MHPKGHNNSEVISSDSYSINEITFTANDNDLKADIQKSHKKTCAVTKTLRTIPQGNQTQ